jgi:hypothetical protein
VGNTGRVTRLNFDGLCFEDSPAGVRNTDYTSVFPAGVNIASTWDKNLMKQRGEAMGEEFRGKGINVALVPAELCWVGNHVTDMTQAWSDDESCEERCGWTELGRWRS